MPPLSTSLSTVLSSGVGSSQSGGAVPPALVAPGAGADDTFDMLTAAPYTLAGTAASGGAGTITYAWTSVSGPTPTFADATSRTSTVTFATDGAAILRLTATDGVRQTASDDVTITVTATLTALLTRMATGSRTNVWYEVDVSTTTVTGQGVSLLSDMGSAPGGLDVVQATDGNRPSKGSATGPNGKNDITFQDTARLLVKGTAGIASGKALFAIGVFKGVAAGAGRLQSFTRTGNDQTTGDPAWYVGDTAANLFFSNCKCVSVAEQGATHTSPAHHTNWYVKSQRYAASIAPETKFNNATASPGFASATGLCDAIGCIVLGHYSASAGGAYCLGFFEAVTSTAGTACLSEEAAIRYYVYKQTGLQ